MNTTPFDVCANYHKGNENSKQANLRTNKAKDTEKILNFVRRNGGRTYVKEIIRELGLKHQTASARLSDLKANGTLRDTGLRAEGCGVVEIVPVQEKLFQ